MTKQDILENRVKSVYLALGSNLGDKKANIEKAKFELIKQNIIISKTSSFYSSSSWPNPKNPRFLNIVLLIKTNLKALNLLEVCKKIEANLGRKKSPKNAPRICDIDIIDYDKMTINNQIVLPHPRMHKRNFVLLPLFEINKDWDHPILKYNIKKLLLSLPNRDITSIKQI